MLVNESGSGSGTGSPRARQAPAGPSHDHVTKRLIAVLPDGAMTSELQTFYSGLDFDDRRRRFRGGVSDESIRSYCAGLDVRRWFAVGMWQAGRLRAVVEVHALDDAFESAELTASCGAVSERFDVMAHLMQIAAFQAAERRCRHLVVDVHGCRVELLDILRDVGERRPGGLIVFDVAADPVAPAIEDRPDVLPSGVVECRTCPPPTDLGAVSASGPVAGAALQRIGSW